MTANAIQHVSAELFRDGMAHLAGAVNIVTTDGPAGRAGFTATAVCSVTDTPPTLLVCLNTSSSSAGIFAENDAICINTIGPDHADLAMRFGGKVPPSERFDGASWIEIASGAPCLEGAAINFDCRITARTTVGTHVVLFCEVIGLARAEGAAISVYFARKFHNLTA